MRRFYSISLVIGFETVVFLLNLRFKSAIAYMAPALPMVYNVIFYGLDTAATYSKLEDTKDLQLVTVLAVSNNLLQLVMLALQNILITVNFKTLVLLSIPIFSISNVAGLHLAFDGLIEKTADLEIQDNNLEELYYSYILDFSIRYTMAISVFKMFIFWLLFDGELNLFFRM